MKERSAHETRDGRQQSLVLVNTGDGKGKTSAAMGTAMRAVARGWRVAVVQFLKSGTWKTGESKMAHQLGIEWWNLGDGFTWQSDDPRASADLGRRAWDVAAGLIAAGEHQLVILDEVTYTMRFGWVRTDDVVDTITNRPATVNVILTGRDAPQEIVAIADTVTEMRMVKHIFERGVPAMKGIDF
jgi:cob(I)alamin adenosyltransferase